MCEPNRLRAHCTCAASLPAAIGAGVALAAAWTAVQGAAATIMAWLHVAEKILLAVLITLGLAGIIVVARALRQRTAEWHPARPGEAAILHSHTHAAAHTHPHPAALAHGHAHVPQMLAPAWPHTPASAAPRQEGPGVVGSQVAALSEPSDKL